MNIRKATGSDIVEIVRMVNAAFEVEGKYRAGSRTSAMEISRLMETSTFVVAVQDERIVGAVHVRVDGRSGYFGMLAVEPALQRGRVGRTLLEAAESHCREHGCTKMTLTTGSFRQELLRYYGKLGYKVTSIEPTPEGGPFTKPIEVVKMTKPS